MEFDGTGDHFNPQPKHKRLDLSPYERNKLKVRLYRKAGGSCQTCGHWIPLKLESGFSIIGCAHLSHIKSKKAGGDDSEENCIIECFHCHIQDRHGLQWSGGRTS